MDDVLSRNFFPIVICSNNSAFHALQSAKACDFTNKADLLVYPSFADIIDSPANGLACLFPKFISKRHVWTSSLMILNPLFEAQETARLSWTTPCSRTTILQSAEQQGALFGLSSQG